VTEHPDTVDRNEVDDLSVERALRVGLEEFELDDADVSLLEREGVEDFDVEETGPVPVVAIIGRPNVGKSTLVNRILGRREAVVEDVPGVTRDRVAYDAEWTGTRFTLVDTGGWEVDATGIHLRVAEQAEIAIELADAVMFVVDATVGATDTDDAVVKLLRRSGKPVILVANKVDDPRVEADAELLALYPDQADLAGARRRLSLFLAQYWGGPTTYSDERGHPRLRMRHVPFTIDTMARDRWLRAMRAAVAEVDPPPGVAEQLLRYFETGAEAMRNTD